MYLSTLSGLGRKSLCPSGYNFGVKLLAVPWMEVANRDELDLVDLSSRLFRAWNWLFGPCIDGLEVSTPDYLGKKAFGSF